MHTRAVLFLAALLLATPVRADRCGTECRASEGALRIIKFFEGYRPYPYKDAVGKPTIGYGHLIRPGESFTAPLIGAAAEELLRKDVEETERSVRRWIYASLFQEQYDALTSWTFNLGGGALRDSTMRRYVNAGRHADVPGQIRRWVYAGSMKLRGLVLRREAEARLYESAG